MSGTWGISWYPIPEYRCDEQSDFYRQLSQTQIEFSSENDSHLRRQESLKLRPLYGRSMENILLVSLLLISGCFAGFTSGLFGVGGGFIVVPALLYVFGIFAYSSDEIIFVAVGTSLATIIVASVRAALTHHKLGSVNTTFLKDWGPWILTGGGAGVGLATFISGSSLKLTFAAGVGIYSIYFLFPAALTKYTFPKLPTGFTRAILGSCIGGFSVLLGIGGGTPVVITMTLCRRPIVEAVGTAACVGGIIGLVGTLGFSLLGLAETSVNLPPWSLGFINLPALLAIAICSIITAPTGARLAHRIDPLYLKRMFGIYLLTVSSIMFTQSL